MRTGRLVVVALMLSASATLVAVQQQDPASSRSEKADKFSPLGFDDLRAYAEAYPAVPGSLAVQQAALSKYWVFQGIAYRGFSQQGSVWTTLGPLSSLQNASTGSSKNISGRVS